MAVKCGACGGYHANRHQVRACFIAKRDLAEASEVARAKRGLAEAREVARVASPRKFQPRETFGQTLRRHRPEKPTCWACSSTDVEYRVLGGKQLLCCPEHPKSSHPDNRADVPGPVEREIVQRTLAEAGVKIAKPNPRSTLQPNGRRKFRAGCEPGKYEGLEHSDDVTRCGRCAGTGQFITGNVNGKPVGPGGPCFRCSGKGQQSCCTTATHFARYEAIMAGNCEDISACCDVVRNDLYDRFGLRVGAGY